MNSNYDFSPTTLDDFVFQSTATRNDIYDLVDNKLPLPTDRSFGLLLYGDYGTGKSQLAILLPQLIEDSLTGGGQGVDWSKYDCEYGDMGQQMIRKIRSQMELVSFNASGRHYFVLDEVDQLTPATQREMKTIMNMRNGLFILCTNHLAKLDEGLRDRCLECSMNAVSDQTMLSHAMRLAARHSIVITDVQRLGVEISKMRGSFRHLAHAIKRCS